MERTGREHAALAHALELARDAQAFASPNPAVGCVLVSPAGEWLGEGAHHFEARDHAEIVALKAAAAAGRSVAGATACVTLEPCSHHGRTGPCADALIAAGIARCVVATVDPNPLVSGTGLERLRDAGVAVELLDPAEPLASAARRLNDAFALAVQLGRAMVTLKAAISVDGMLAPPPAGRTAREPVWLTGAAARAEVAALRHTSDALLTGVGTVLADDPALTDRTGQPRRRPLLRAIADSQLRTPLDARVAQAGTRDLLFFAAADAPAAREQAWLDAGAHVARAHTRWQPAEMLATLAAHECRSVLLEAGAGMNASFLAAGLVDRVVLYVSERELGAGAVPFSARGDSPFELIARLSGVTRHTLPGGIAGDQRGSEDVVIRGYLRDPWELPRAT